jgi:hypothetical protein
MSRIPRPRRASTPDEQMTLSSVVPPPQPPAAPQFTDAAEEVEAWTSRKRRPRGEGDAFSESRMRAAAARLDDVIKSQAWQDAKPIEFLALFMRMHAKVYGTPFVSTSLERRRATLMFATCIRSYFKDDRSRFAEFMRWTWRREMRTEKWRRENGQPGRVIGVRLQCSSMLFNEWCVDVERGYG